MKKSIIKIVIIIVCVAIAAFFIYSHHKNIVRKKEYELQILYKHQNMSLRLSQDNFDNRIYFHGADELDKSYVLLATKAYSTNQDKYELTLQDVEDYLSSEYDEEGELRVYSRPEPLEDYIEWWFHGGDEKVEAYSSDIDRYLMNNHYPKRIFDLNYKELVEVVQLYENAEENDNKLAEIANQENDIHKVVLEKNTDYTDTIKNQLDYSLASFEVDLDCNGINEAFVVAGYDGEYNDIDTPESNVWTVYSIWFVDEQMQSHELDDLFIFGDYIDIFEELYAKNINGKEYLIMNGQCGAEGLGAVYTLNDGKLVNAAESISCEGQKAFSNNDLIWYREFYGMTMEKREGEDLLETATGRCYMPYYLYLENDQFKLYDAKEISLEEAEELEGVNLTEICKIATSIQCILRDNKELDVNYVVQDVNEFEFKANVYMQADDNNNYQMIDTLDGYFAVNVNDDHNSWGFFE